VPDYLDKETRFSLADAGSRPRIDDAGLGSDAGKDAAVDAGADAGSADAGSPDAGARDAGSRDAGRPDAADDADVSDDDAGESDDDAPVDEPVRAGKGSDCSLDPTRDVAPTGLVALAALGVTLALRRRRRG
jgi:MYXO-CTERM domain-containing protein